MFARLKPCPTYTEIPCMMFRQIRVYFFLTNSVFGGIISCREKTRPQTADRRQQIVGRGEYAVSNKQ